MESFLGNPALRLLMRLKFVGGLRRQARRLKEPKHWIFLILGVLVAFSWIASVFMGSVLRSGGLAPAVSNGPGTYAAVKVAMLVLTILTVIGAFSHRGVYLPKEEIELCFSAPISRSDLVRYRLVVNLLKSLFAGLLFGVGAATRLSGGIYAFVGVFVTFLTIPILGQAFALMLGDTENKLARVSRKLPLGVVTRVLVIVVIVGGVLLVSGQDFSFLEKMLGDSPRGGFSLEEFARRPVVSAVLAPFTPWARMITAETAADFVPWFLFALGFWFLAFEGTARIPVDYRETSLSTSADVAKRLNRMRRGAFGPGQGNLTKTTLGWDVPWIFGRGAFGAVAWHKTTSIVRNSRGPMILSAIVILFITLLGTAISRRGEDAQLFLGTALPAAMGTLYLCAGLRFDFRSDLELMDRLKTWPLRPSLLFLAMILPEIVLVCLLVLGSMLAQAAWIGRIHPGAVAVFAIQPLFTLTWVAIDNAVFLFSPVRYAPGEDGALQNMGRAMLLMLLRVALMSAIALFAFAPAWLVYYLLTDMTELTPGQALWPAGALAWTLCAAADVGLVVAGGWMLRRFDVARDKPV